MWGWDSPGGGTSPSPSPSLLLELELVRKTLEQSSLLITMLRTVGQPAITLLETALRPGTQFYSDKTSGQSSDLSSRAAAAEAMSTLRPAGHCQHCDCAATSDQISATRKYYCDGAQSGWERLGGNTAQNKDCPANSQTFHCRLISNIRWYCHICFNRIKLFSVPPLSALYIVRPCQHKKSAYNFVPAGSWARESRAWHWTGLRLNILLTCGGRVDTGDRLSALSWCYRAQRSIFYWRTALSNKIKR